MKSRFSEEQIIRILKEQGAGRPTKELCRQHGVSPGTFYKWDQRAHSCRIRRFRHARKPESIPSTEL